MPSEFTSTAKRKPCSVQNNYHTIFQQNLKLALFRNSNKLRLIHMWIVLTNRNEQ